MFSPIMFDFLKQNLGRSFLFWLLILVVKILGRFGSFEVEDAKKIFLQNFML